MIVGFGGGGLGISRQQVEALKPLLRRLPIEAAVHRGCTGMETMIHNVIRSVYPLMMVHVVPIAGTYSSIASMPSPKVPQTLIYDVELSPIVNACIIRTIHGLIFLPGGGTEGWDLANDCREHGVPIIFIQPNGKVTLERNEI